MESLTRICHAAVKCAPSGLSAEDVADVLGVNYKTMMAELSGAERHKFGLDLLVPLVQATGSDAPLKAIGRACGCVFIRLPEVGKVEQPMLDSMAASVREFGDLLAALGDALRDGVISRVEADRITKEGHEALEAVMKVISLARKEAE